jgi:hypothetical protein
MLHMSEDAETPGGREYRYFENRKILTVFAHMFDEMKNKDKETLRYLDTVTYRHDS